MVAYGAGSSHVAVRVSGGGAKTTWRRHAANVSGGGDDLGVEFLEVRTRLRNLGEGLPLDLEHVHLQVVTIVTEQL